MTKVRARLYDYLLQQLTFSFWKPIILATLAVIAGLIGAEWQIRRKR